jgi:uncharacterized protein YecE (DUF72 family)
MRAAKCRSRAAHRTTPSGIRQTLHVGELRLPVREIGERNLPTVARFSRHQVGAVLFQLSPQFSKNRERLASPRRYLYAFEFCHKSWYEDDIYQLLRAHDIQVRLLGPTGVIG